MDVPTAAKIPNQPCVFVMVGPSGSGKSTWAKTHSGEISVLSSDHMRQILTDNADHQGCSADAFDTIEALAKLRLQYGRPVVIDATNTRAKTRLRWLALAREFNVPALVMRVAASEAQCIARQQHRERKVAQHVIERQLRHLETIDTDLVEEGWDAITIYQSAQDETPNTSHYKVIKDWTPPLSSKIDDHGVRYQATHVDIIGDVHGCYDELIILIEQMGWIKDDAQDLWSHPDERLLVFVGDLVDRGPRSLDVVTFVAQMVEAKRAALVMGNHDDKFQRYLLGNDINIRGGLETTIAELDALDETQRQVFVDRANALFEQTPMWALFAPGSTGKYGLAANIVVSHAAWKPSLIGQKRSNVRFYCMFGPNTGEKDERGYPERLDWVERYPQTAPLCVTGHTPFSATPTVRDNTLCVDTGCVFGGKLTAFRYPEHDLVAVDALEIYCDLKVLESKPVLVSYAIYQERKRQKMQEKAQNLTAELQSNQEAD